MNMAQEERLRIVRYLRDTKAIFDKQQADAFAAGSPKGAEISRIKRERGL